VADNDRNGGISTHRSSLGVMARAGPASETLHESGL
jgi:hypothetical protein